jgi:hypothetical protein
VGTPPSGTPAGAFFAGQLFGLRNSWVGDPGMVFHDLHHVRHLLYSLEILELRETERDGDAFSGPKRWHVYEIPAQQPATHNQLS